MQQAVLRLFPDIQASYRFTNRNLDTLFSRQCIERFRTNLSCAYSLSSPHLICAHLRTVFSTIALTEEESEWLKQQCPYLTEDYLAYLASYRFKPEQVKVKYIPVTSDDLLGRLEIDITGPWVETILWEVPLMACLSETYFQTVAVDWNYGQQDGVSLFIRAATFPLNRVYGRQKSLMRKAKHCSTQTAISANSGPEEDGPFMPKISSSERSYARPKRFQAVVAYSGRATYAPHSRKFKLQNNRFRSRSISPRNTT